MTIHSGAGERLVRNRAALTATDWQLLIAAALAQVAAAAALRVMPLTTLQTRAARFRRLAQAAMRGSEDRVIWAVQVTGRRLAGLSTCLVRALVVDLVLDSPGRPLCLTIGVRRTADGALDAHAWVEREGRVLIGTTSDTYVPLVGWDSHRA